MDKLTKEQRSKNMKAVKSKGSRIEILLANALWSKKLRYRKNDSSVFGTPDFVFKSKKIAVFCDSEFWHGKDWERKKLQIKSNIDFWIPKIERNIQRDLEVNKYLLENGWVVIRFWGTEIKCNPGSCAGKVADVIRSSTKTQVHIQSIYEII